MKQSRAAKLTLRLAAACAAAVAVTALFWHSLGAVIAGWIVDFFVVVIRLFLALVDLLPGSF
ncbi:MAG TPA: hypothetical protein VL244_14315 [Alphaproteobacteria bacterium]|nr:hypothetical protein [Alphaproteobacteria bacterium]